MYMLNLFSNLWVDSQPHTLVSKATTARHRLELVEVPVYNLVGLFGTV